MSKLDLGKCIVNIIDETGKGWTLRLFELRDYVLGAIPDYSKSSDETTAQPKPSIFSLSILVSDSVPAEDERVLVYHPLAKRWTLAKLKGQVWYSNGLPIRPPERWVKLC